MRRSWEKGNQQRRCEGAKKTERSNLESRKAGPKQFFSCLPAFQIVFPGLRIFASSRSMFIGKGNSEGAKVGTADPEGREAGPKQCFSCFPAFQILSAPLGIFASSRFDFIGFGNKNAPDRFRCEA